MRILFLAGLLLLTIQTTHAAPVLYEFSAAYQFEVRGDPSTDMFTGVTADQLLYGSGATVSGTFLYDSTVAVTELAPGVGVSLGSVTDLFFSVNGEQASDVFGAILINDDTVNGGDYLGILADPMVGVPLPHELSGFSRTDGEGIEFALYNLRINFLEGITDFINGLVNPAILPPTGFDGLANVAVDFLAFEYSSHSFNKKKPA